MREAIKSIRPLPLHKIPSSSPQIMMKHKENETSEGKKNSVNNDDCWFQDGEVKVGFSL